jgi:hypothetical protein
MYVVENQSQLERFILYNIYNAILTEVYFQ